MGTVSSLIVYWHDLKHGREKRGTIFEPREREVRAVVCIPSPDRNNLKNALISREYL